MTKTYIKGLDDLKRAFARIKGATDTVLGPAALAGGERVADFAKLDAPGPHIEAVITKVTGKRAEVAIGPDKEHWYYMFAETGADAHEIVPKNKEALAFPMAGGKVVVRRVRHHPGRAARPYLRPALDNHEAEILDAIGKKIREAIKA